MGGAHSFVAGPDLNPLDDPCPPPKKNQVPWRGLEYLATAFDLTVGLGCQRMVCVLAGKATPPPLPIKLHRGSREGEGSQFEV